MTTLPLDEVREVLCAAYNDPEAGTHAVHFVGCDEADLLSRPFANASDRAASLVALAPDVSTAVAWWNGGQRQHWPPASVACQQWDAYCAQVENGLPPLLINRGRPKNGCGQ